MDQNLMKRQRELTDRLNRYRNEYYNLNSPSVSDAAYDRLFEELQAVEKQTGVQMANSPTSTVGYPAVSKLEKTNHQIPLLSLDKVKNTEELCRFMGEHQVMFMLKLDGLTVKLTYEGGRLVEAATRGDGDVGEIVTHNTCAISGIPARIQYEDRLVVTGEAFIRPSDFEQLKTTLVDGDGKPYKNGRNLAAGSVRLFDAGACMGRRLQFMPFNVLEGMEEVPRKSERLKALRPLGFLPCKYMVTKRPLTQGKPRKASGSSSSMRQTPTFPSTVSLSPTTTSRCQKAAGAPAITTRTALLSNLRMTCSRQNSKRLNGRLAAPARSPRLPFLSRWRSTAARCPEPACTTCPSLRTWNWRRAAVSW